MSKKSKNRGCIVIMASGKRGRTYNNQETINGKIPVYPEKEAGTLIFSDKGILCKPESLKLTGYID